MHITFSLKAEDTRPWIEALRAHLPEARMSAWQPGADSADYAVVWAPSQQLIDEQGALKALFNIGAGVDALMKLRIPGGVKLVRLDDAGMSVQMAEYVVQAVIRHFRELDQSEADMRAGRWAYRAPRQREAYPVGIMGLGVLGERVARAVAAFEFPVLGYSRGARQIDGVRCFSGAAGLDEFLARTRILVNLLPLTPETENIIDARLLARLMPGAYVINVARGAHLVDEDLLAAIASGQVAGATLDVFREEPLPEGHALRGEPRITLTPHTSARTLLAESMAQIAGKIRALEAGEAIRGVVDPRRGY